MAPKMVSRGKIVLNVAVDIAVCNFNDGLKSIMEIMQVLEMSIGYNCYNFCIEADAQCIKAAERCRSGKRGSSRALKSDRKESLVSMLKDNSMAQALPIKSNLFLYTKNRKTLNAFFSKRHFPNLHTS